MDVATPSVDDSEDAGVDEVASVYTAHPIPSRTDSIRLLSFSRDSSGTISCTFSVYPLAQCPTYVALSYTWSSHLLEEIDFKRRYTDFHFRMVPCADLMERWIMLGDVRFPVGENLWMALNAILDARDPSSDVPSCISPSDDRTCFWIDAISINQADLIERASQVALMGRIYSLAESIIGWLTPDQRFIDSRLMWGEVRDGLELYGAKLWSTTEPAHMDATTRFVRRSIIYNSYWDRLWICQEAVLARKIRFLYMDLWLDEVWWEDVAMAKIESGNEKGAMAFVAMHESWMLRTIHRTFPTNDNDPRSLNRLRYHLHRTGLKLCSDARDRVYALLVLLSVDFKLVPDYMVSTLDLYFQVLDAELGYDGSEVLDLSYCIELAQSLRLELDLYPISATTAFLRGKDHFCKGSSVVIQIKDWLRNEVDGVMFRREQYLKGFMNDEDCEGPLAL